MTLHRPSLSSPVLLGAAMGLLWTALGGGVTAPGQSSEEPSPSRAEIPSRVVLVGFTAGNAVVFVDLEDHTPVEHIVFDGEPWSLAVSPDGERAYVGLWSGEGIAVVDVPDASVVATIPVPVPDGKEWLVRSLAVSSDGAFVFAVDRYSQRLLMFDTSDHRLVATVEGVGNEDLELSPRGGRAYVTGPAFTVVDTASHDVVESIDLGDVSEGMALTPDGALAYVAQPGSVAVVDTAAGAVIDRIETPFGGPGPQGGSGPADVVIPPDGRFAYRTSTCCETVAVIDTATNEVVDTVAVASGPSGMAVSPDGGLVYVASSGDDVLVAVDTLTREARRITVTGDFPIPVAVASF